MRGYGDRLEQSPAALNILDLMSEVRARLHLFNDASHYEERQEIQPHHHRRDIRVDAAPGFPMGSPAKGFSGKSQPPA